MRILVLNISSGRGPKTDTVRESYHCCKTPSGSTNALLEKYTDMSRAVKYTIFLGRKYIIVVSLLYALTFSTADTKAFYDII
jgi:hypothetical protein